MPDDEYGHVFGGNAVSGVYHSVIPRDRGHQLSGRAQFSALAHLIGDLHSSMLASMVERMMFIRLNRHLIDEVRELDATVAQARARVAKSAKKSVAAQKERSNIWVALPPRYHEWSRGSYSSFACSCSVFSRNFFFVYFVAVSGVT